MKYAIIKNNIVENVIAADAQFASQIGAIAIPDEFGIGDLYDGTDFSKPAAPEETVEEKKTRYLRAVDSHLNTTAQTYGYDNIVTAVTYADENSVSAFQVEGTALRAWRSLVYEYLYAQLAEVEVGNRSMPETVEDLIAELPTYTPPV